ncbi:MAG: SNF2-related protein, partial [Bacillota bacterium]
SEDIFLDEDGNYQPINEVCMGEVYSKIDKWDQMKSDIEKKLSAEDITDEERELLVLKSRKIESQIYELKRRAGSKELQYMPVMMNDANKLFPIEHLNQFLQAQLGADFADQIIYDPRTNLFTLQDESLRELYTLYIDKGSNDKEDKKRMQELLKAYFNKDDNPVMLIALNKVNGVALPALRSEKGERLLEKVNGLDAAFKEYLVNVEDADKITDNYNRAYNNYIQKKFDDRPIEGLSKFAYDREIKKDAEGNPIVARDKAGAHSWATVRRMYEQGKGLIAHGVGLGKTLEGIILCLLSKETGRAKKPLIVTPKSVLINWAEEIRKWTNEVNFLVVGYTEKMVDGKMKWVEDNKEEKQLKLQRIATEDFDMVLISRDTYRNIDFSPETKNNMLKELANKYFELPEKPSKKVKAKYDKLMASLAKVMTNKDAIEGVYLDNLGIDMVIRDEGHDTKNLLVPMEEEIAGINSTMSQRALHNFFSSKIIRGQNGEKGVFTLTATPISNSPLEVFNMMLPFAEKELQDLGVKNMDEFIQKFAYTEVVPTADPDGRIVEKSKFAGWKSPDILRKIFFRFTDYMTKDDLTPEESKSAGIKFPKETPHKVISHLNDGQRALMEHCRLRLYAVRYKKKIYNDQGELTGIEFDEKKMQDDIQAGLVTEKYLKLTEQYFNGEYLPRFNELNSKRNPEDNPIDDTYFAIQSDMIKIASDLDWYKEAQEPKKDKNGNLIPDIRFGKKIDENYVNQYNDVHKMNQLTEGVAGMYKSGGKQIIFAINTSLHEKLRRDFIAAGVKPEEIAIVNGATMKTGEDRVRVSREFNAGKYKVIIGNYATMGEGLNFNKMTSDIHHLQPAWNYLMIEQGNGRGIRQGNDLDFVNTHYYLTRGSVDTFMHDKIMTKGRMVDDFMRGLNNKWDDEVKMDEDELMIALADNPEEAERIYKSRENKLQKVLEEKEKNKNYSQFDQIFTIKNQMNRIEDKESKRYKSLAQELENLKNRLNNSNFSHKQHLDLDEKP